MSLNKTKFDMVMTDLSKLRTTIEIALNIAGDALDSNQVLTESSTQEAFDAIHHSKDLSHKIFSSLTEIIEDLGNQKSTRGIDVPDISKIMENLLSTEDQ